MVVSRTETIAEDIRKYLQKIDLLVLTAEPEDPGAISKRREAASSGPQGVFGQSAGVDLVVIDESSFNSRQAALETAKIRKNLGFQVLLLTSESISEPDDESLLASVDAYFDANAIEGHRSLLIRLLYSGTSGGQTIPRNTLPVWTLMEARVTAIILGTLFLNLSRTHTVPLNQVRYSTDDQVRELNNQFDVFIKNNEFPTTLTSRLLNELPPLLWAYLVGSLVGRGQCELESFGTFTKIYNYGRLSIQFESKSIFSQLTMPDMKFKGGDLDPLALRICGQNVIPYLYDHAVSGGNIDDLFFRAMRDTRNSLLSLKDVMAKKLSEEEIWGHQWKFSSWVGTLARASALASYYALVISIGRTIHEVGQRAVPEIGTFSSSDRQIIFEASPDLLQLVDANETTRSAHA
jgi:hypothetical protein